MDAVFQEKEQEVQAQRRRLLAAWQVNLVHLSERLRDDTLLEVLEVQTRRVLLLTKERIVYCHARISADGTAVCRVLWQVRVRDVTNILSASMSFFYACHAMKSCTCLAALLGGQVLQHQWERSSRFACDKQLD
jgi:hypothetical protein